MSVENPQAGEEKESNIEWSFHDLQTRVLEIYEQHDLECGYGPDTILVKLLGNAEILKKIVRKDPQNIEALEKALTNIFIWTATIANEGRIIISNTMSDKYAYGCPRCGHIPCLLTRGEPCKDTGNFLGTIPQSMPNTISQWQKHLAEIYPNNFASGMQEALKITSERLLDEVSELISSTHPDVERELSQFSVYRSREDQTFPWKGEIADVLAWALGVAEVLNRLTENYSVEKSLIEKYKDGCPTCHHPRCQCPREKTIIEDLRNFYPVI